MKKYLTILSIVVLFLIMGTNTASAFYFHIHVYTGIYNEKTKGCDNGTGICKVVIDWGLGDPDHYASMVGSAGGFNVEGTIDQANKRLSFTVLDALPQGSDDGKSRNKITIHEDMELSQEFSNEFGIDPDQRVVIKKGTYSIGGRTSRRGMFKYDVVMMKR